MDELALDRPDNSFRRLWWAQANQQEQIVGQAPDPHDVEMLLREYIIGVITEMSEFADAAMRFRSHIMIEEPANKRALACQLVDALKYWLGIAWLLGITPEELLDAFDAKTDIVYDRMRAQSRQLADRNVVVVDMDGVICDLFGKYSELKDGAGDQEGKDIVQTRVFSTGEWMEACEPVPGAVANLNKIREEFDARIVLLTSRPAYRIKNVHQDIKRWLAKIGLEVDLLLFSRDKAEEVSRSVLPANILAIVEDRWKHAIELSHLKRPVYMMTGHTCHVDWDPMSHLAEATDHNIQIVESWGSVYKSIKERLS